MEVRKIERQFAQEIRNIIQKNIAILPKQCFLVEESSNEEDTKLAFDLYFSADIQVSVRIRKYKYINYDDITIRCKSKCGRTTEIDKLSNGMGQLYFYGWMDAEEEHIIKWYLVDIDKIRYLLKTKGQLNKNNDGTQFRSYNIELLKNNNAFIKGQIKKNILC